MSVLCWNVEGLSSKLSENSFVQYICAFDICCFTETFTSIDFNFEIYFSDYFVFHSPAVKLSHQGRRSGGVVTIVKKSCMNTVSQLPCTYDNMTVLRLCSITTGELILISVYIPPVDSQYYKGKELKCNLVLLEEVLSEIQEAYPNANIIICGDLNARTSQWNLHTSDCDYDDDQDQLGLQDYCYCPNTVYYRQSEDNVTNQFGNILIELCKVYHICILNGSNVKDKKGKLTYVSQHGESTIDYCLLLATNPHFKAFVNVGSRIESSHMPLEITVDSETTQRFTAKQVKQVSRIIWDENKEEEVLKIMQSADFIALLNRADTSLNTCVNSSVKLLTAALGQTIECMRHTFISSNQIKQRKTEWYDDECKNSRLLANRALFAYRKTLAIADKTLYTQSRNNYKKLIRQKKQNYEKTLSTYLLKNLHNSDKFWHIIRKKSWKRAKLPDIGIETWKSYFESLLTQNSAFVANLIADDENGTDVNDLDLDDEITTDEVDQAISKLGRGKAPGLDEISSELVKLGRKQLVPFLTKLFNVIYDTRVFPEDWSRSVIIPIYKGGNPQDPQNYRGISLLSVISKLF